MVGQTIAHYRILERLGQGGMGVVYRAEDMRLGRPVALKFLPAELARDEQALQRFQREARAASAMNHPNVCVIHDIGRESGQDFIVMELLEGQTLETLLRGRLPAIDRVLDLARQIADALDAAHAKGIVHRDIKPSNVFVTTRGQAKVMDFGIAKLLPAAGAPAPDSTLPFGATQTALTGTGITVGTTPYMSPEQLEGKEIDLRSDLFSFGALLYEMSTGVHPFAGSSPASTVANILTAEPAPLTERIATAPPELDRIVRKCLRKKPEQRYQSTRELVVDLENLKRDSGERQATESLATETDEGSLLAAVARSARASPRRWWEVNLFWSLAVYAVVIWLAWQTRSLSRGVWRDQWFYISVAVVALAASLRLVLLNVALWIPRELPARVRQLYRFVQVANLLVGGLLLSMLNQIGFPDEGSNPSPALAALAGVMGAVQFLIAFVYEPMVDRAAFPRIFTDSRDAARASSQREAFLRLAGGHLVFILLLALPVASGSLTFGDVITAAQHRDVTVLILALLILGGTIALATHAAEIARRNLDAVRAFHRWFPAWLALDLVGIGVGWVWVTSNKNTPAVISFGMIALLLVLPFGQLRLAREILGPEIVTGRLPREQRLGRLLALAQFFLAGLFALASFVISRDVQGVVASLAAPIRQGALPSWLPALIWGMFILYVALTVIWLVAAVEMWLRPQPMARLFQRWFLYFFLPDVMIAWMGFALVAMMGLELTRNLALGFFSFLALLAVPFGQLLIATRIAPGPPPSRLQLLAPWLKRKTPDEPPKPA